MRISQLYLQVLRHKETLDVIDENLVRHHQIAKQLTTIVQHDSGRMSELTQVKARTLKVEMSRAETERNLNLALSQLSILTQRQLTVDQFVDPFRSTTSGVILARFQDDNLENNPSYKAQVADAQSLDADVKVASAMRKPALNLEVSATPITVKYFYGSLGIFSTKPAITAKHKKNMPYRQRMSVLRRHSVKLKK